MNDQDVRIEEELDLLLSGDELWVACLEFSGKRALCEMKNPRRVRSVFDATDEECLVIRRSKDDKRQYWTVGSYLEMLRREHK